MLQISAEEFRRKLAGLQDDKVITEYENLAIRELCIDLVLVLREVFGDSLDRKTLWHRISNAITVAAHKCGGRAERFIAECLDFVKADESGVVRSEGLKKIYQEVKCKDKDWQIAFIKECLTYKNLILLEAREVASTKATRRVQNDE